MAPLFQQPLLTFSNPSLNRGFDDSNLKSYYKFNEASGDIINLSQAVADLGSGADIQITGATYGATGKIGDAVSFDGINDHGVMGSSFSQFNFMHNTSAKFTVACWLKPLSIGAGGRELILSTSSGSGGNTGMFITFEAAAASFRGITLGLSNAGTHTELGPTTGTGRMPDDTNWHFVVIKYDQSLGSNNLTISVDDGTVENFNKAGTRTNSNATAVLTLATLASLVLYMDTLVDEMSIWNSILTAGQITSLYNSGSGLAIY